ncbi:OmpA family protein [Flagellimonas iocasae]|uniref:OmpA family protein n=1 Tax=Flagellimonas iocasae TaxID=2055905 RepID=A0ABW4XXC7_9FLAO
MKKPILLFLMLLTLGINAQEVSLLQFDDESGSSISHSDNTVDSQVDFVKHLDGLSDRKLTQFVRKKGVSAKLIQKGDEYFDKMWYAEAARIYDIVLEKSEEKHTSELLAKAGDANYYSGNLEKSYKWYHELYENFGDQITEDRFYKYTNALKGTGKYRRAAELTKLFRQKRNEPLNELENLAAPTWKKTAMVEIKNLAINSKYSDFAPMFHKDSEVVFASAQDSSFLTTRRYRWNNQPYLDLYTANTKDDSGDLYGAHKFSRKINTKYHEASVAFSPDQKTIYFTRNNYGKKLKRGKNGINHLKIYQSKLVNGEWTDAVEVAFNSENYSTGHPSISQDGTKMYFVSDKPGGFGETDIYVVDILENGGFSEPKNLGRGINSSGKEMFPYITENTLYFSSNRAMGLGGLDVYRADYDNELFGIVYNLGEPINSSRDDFSYIVDASGEKGYFASNRKGGKGDDDIYSFTSIENRNTISGTIKDANTGELLEGAQVVLLNNDSFLLAEVITDTDGSYRFEGLESQSDYLLKVSKKGYFEKDSGVRTKNNIKVEADQSLQPLKEIIDEEKQLVNLEPDAIYFDFDRFDIKPKAAKELDKLVAILNEYQDMVIRIESHTDAIGSSVYNKYLSDKRAKSTRDYIISQGIDPSRIASAIGYGEERPLNDCVDGHKCPPDKHKLNRRSEFIIVSQ